MWYGVVLATWFIHWVIAPIGIHDEGLSWLLWSSIG